MRLPLRKGCTSCFSHRVAVVNERWRARGRAWSRSQEHGRVVTYIVYVRVCVYRLFTMVYILYLSAHIERRSSRLHQPRRRAPRRRCPPPCTTPRGHETLVAVRSGAMFVWFSLPCPFSPSLRFAQGSNSRVCISRPAGARRQTRADHEEQSHRPYDTQTCTMLTAANT